MNSLFTAIIDNVRSIKESSWNKTETIETAILVCKRKRKPRHYKDLGQQLEELRDAKATNWVTVRYANGTEELYGPLRRDEIGTILDMSARHEGYEGFKITDTKEERK